MADQNHVGWLTEGRIKWNERRSLVRFAPDLSGLDFREVLLGSRFASRFRDFKRFNFSDANLSGANLAGLDFSNAKFRNANLRGANLSGSDLEFGDFRGADLSTAVAPEANFAGAKLEGIDLREVSLSGAILTNEQLDQVILLADQRLSLGRTTDQFTRLKGLSPPATEFYQSAPRAGSSDADGKPTYLVLFATNRRPVKNGNRTTFSGDRGTQLNFGTCQVVVPESHEVGSLGSPFFKRMFKRKDDKLYIWKLVTLNGSLYWKLVRENFLNGPESTPPTVFIHGYRTSFEEAVLWAAQLGFDLGLKRGANLFSWPSQGKLTGYLADESTAEWSKYHLAEYLTEFAVNCDGTGINVIAHSMGCRCLALALELIGSRQPSLLRSFNQFIFAAADVDQDAMRRLGPHAVSNVGRTTSYVCGGDLALSASGWAHKYARVGLLPPAFIYEDIDTVEVEKADLLGLGHGYVASAASVLRDIFDVLRHSTPPADRFSIFPAGVDATRHWKLKG